VIDIAAVLGGLALGASVAAIVDGRGAARGLGQGVVTGSPAGGGGGTSLGPTIGPPAMGPTGPMGPFVVGPGEEVEEGAAIGPTVSVEPEAGLPGDSFFGISAPVWFWPLNWPWASWSWRPARLVCRSAEIDGEEVLLCRRTHPVVPVAWGPPAPWL
jgi:hypothetical protein